MSVKDAVQLDPFWGSSTMRSMSQTIATPVSALMATQLKGVTVLNVFYELVANSLDAGAKRIQVRILRTDKDVTVGSFIEVIDDGHGILGADLDKIVNAMKPGDSMHKGLGRFVAAKCFGSVTYVSVASDGKKRSFEICPGTDGAFTRDDIKTDNADPSEAVRTVVRTGRLSEVGTSKAKTKNEFLDPIYLKEKLMDHFLLKLKENQDITISIMSQAEGVLFSEVTFSGKDIGEFQEKVSTRAFGGGHVKVLWSSRNHEGRGDIDIQAIVDGRGAKIGRGISCNVSVPPNLHLRAFVQWPGLCVDGERGAALVDDEAHQEAFEKTLKGMLSSIIREALPNLKRERELVIETIDSRYPDLSGLVTMGDDFYTISEALDTARSRYHERKDKAAGLRGSGSEVPYAESDDLQRRALADYVQHRQDVLVALKRLVDTRSDEGTIHDLFLPRRLVADERSKTCTNMWILDDKYMSFLSMHSDTPIGVTMRRTGLSAEDKEVEYGKKEPDLLLLYKSPSGTDGLIVELKKPFAKADENHKLSKQLIIGEETLRQSLGPAAQIDMIGIATIDPETVTTLRGMNYQQLIPGRDDVYCSFSLNGLTRKFIISYDKLINDASQRNEVFLRVLREGFMPACLPDVSALPEGEA